ncbi:hypothetical protein FO519_007258 [Halicephalobus sp. NKZ332]|nr:hypothetical protein FO519_007258 [Halicephalobus sp. NKZ332]
MNRTIISAIANMAGFYFAEGIASVDYPYNWQWPSFWTPVPVHTEPWSTDTLMNLLACPLSKDLHDLSKQTPEFLEFQNVSQPLYKFLSKHAGKKMNISDDVFTVCDSIIMEHQNNLPLTWQNQIIPQCKDYFAEIFNFWFGWNMAPFKGHNMKIEKPKVIGGRLLWEIITRMQQKYENFLDPSKNSWIKDLKYYAYSGHDSVLSVFAALMDFPYIDYDRNSNPTPSNAYTIELWIDDDMEPIVKVLYWKKENPTFIDVSKSVSGCKFTLEGCSLDHFAARSEKYRPPESFEQYCNTRLTDI